MTDDNRRKRAADKIKNFWFGHPSDGCVIAITAALVVIGCLGTIAIVFLG